MSEVRTGFVSNWVRTNVDVMRPKEIGFVHPPRRWQAECFETIAPSTPIAFINAPTGSGKSTMLSMLAYHRTINDIKKKAIIVVPQTIIGKGFKSKIFKLPNDNVVDWSIGLDLVSESNDNFNQLVSFIIDDIHYSKEYPFERVAVCSKDTLIGAFKKLSDEDKEKYWDNLLICIDETHHLQMNEISDGVYEMNELSQVVDYSFKNNNNEIILVSATMFRGDKKGLISNEMISQAINYKLPFDIYMGEMNHLKSFSYDFVINTGDYTNDISKTIKNLFNDNLKKLFIYVPHTTHFMSTGNKTREGKKNEIKEILNQLKIVLNGDSISLDEKTGIYHIQNSEGLDYKVCDLYDEELFNSKTKHFVNDEKINEDRDSLDCIITMNRGKEGFDWEHANGMVIVGKRGSLTDVIQMVGRLLRDKKGKEKVKVLHMLPFSPHQPIAPNLDNSLNDFFKAIAISLLMEDVFTPTPIQTNDDSAPTGQLSGSSSSSSSSNNIFDDLGLDENFIVDLFDKAQKSLVNIAGSLVESQGTYSPGELKEQMPSIVKKWVEDNDIEADEGQIEELASKVYNQFAKRTLQMQGLNVSNINWQMIESADPIEFTLRYVGKDTTLESLKELRRLISYGESESNSMCHKVCQWILENNKKPSQASSNKEERKLGKWITYQRQAKVGNNEKPFYISNLNIAKSYNLDNLFERLDLETESNEICHQYFNWVKDMDGEFPSSKSLIEEEKLLGCWIVKQRSAKQGVGLQKYYESNEKIAESYGYKNIFERLDYEVVSNERSIEVIKFYNIYKRLPKRCEDEYESKLAQHLTKIKSKYLSNDSKFYLSDYKIFESAGLQNVFLSAEEDFNNKLTELFEWIKNENNNVLPREKSSNKTEVSKAKFLGSLKRNPSDSSIKIAIEYGFPDIFNKKNYEQESNFLTTQLCEFYKENDRFPYESGDDLEKKLSRHHKSCRVAKSGTSGNVWYDSDQKIAESYGYDTIFDNLPQIQSNENCKSFCEYIIAEKRFPSGSKNAPENERRLRKWHDGKKAIYLGKKTGAFYESDVLIATSYGFTNLFELSSYNSETE